MAGAEHVVPFDDFDNAGEERFHRATPHNSQLWRTRRPAAASAWPIRHRTRADISNTGSARERAARSVDEIPGNTAFLTRGECVAAPAHGGELFSSKYWRLSHVSPYIEETGGR